MKRNDDSQCKRNPKNNSLLPSPGNGNTGGGPFTNGCKQGVPSWDSDNSRPWMLRQSLGGSTFTSIPGSGTNANLYRDVIRCTRSMINCITNGAMYEANLTRNCGYGNSSCGGGGNHDVVIFAIAIGKKDLDAPQQSLDENAKCMLARIANATDILNAATGVVETMTAVCNAVFTTMVDGDTHADLKEGWPCGTGPCIDTTQEKGKVFTIDVTGNVTAQLNQVFNEIASLLKLRLVL